MSSVFSDKNPEIHLLYVTPSLTFISLIEKTPPLHVSCRYNCQVSSILYVQ